MASVTEKICKNMGVKGVRRWDDRQVMGPRVQRAEEALRRDLMDELWKTLRRNCMRAQFEGGKEACCEPASRSGKRWRVWMEQNTRCLASDDIELCDVFERISGRYSKCSKNCKYCTKREHFVKQKTEKSRKILQINRCVFVELEKRFSFPIFSQLGLWKDIF